jgi:hypothetical protein
MTISLAYGIEPKPMQNATKCLVPYGNPFIYERRDGDALCLYNDGSLGTGEVGSP